MEILDASVGLKWVLTEADSDKARQLRDEFRKAIRDFRSSRPCLQSDDMRPPSKTADRRAAPILTRSASEET